MQSKEAKKRPVRREGAWACSSLESFFQRCKREMFPLSPGRGSAKAQCAVFSLEAEREPVQERTSERKNPASCSSHSTIPFDDGARARSIALNHQPMESKST